MKNIFFAILLSLPLNAFAAWTQGSAGGVSYWAYNPKAVAPASLMVSLHGCTQHAVDLKTYANWEATAESANMVVILPDVPNGGVVMGCWDYFGPAHDAVSGHSGALIKMTEEILRELGPKIDTREVYISGLSSGASEAATVGCLRPDLFAGVGLAAGPLLSTTLGELQRPNVRAPRVVELCRSYAGDRAADLSQQLISVVVADTDYIVNNQHSKLAVDALTTITGATTPRAIDMSSLAGANTGGQGQEFLNAQGEVRVSYLINSGLGHAWPSGNGSPVVKYINGNSLNYPDYLAKFFRANNPRLNR